MIPMRIGCPGFGLISSGLQQEHRKWKPLYCAGGAGKDKMPFMFHRMKWHDFLKVFSMYIPLTAGLRKDYCPQDHHFLISAEELTWRKGDPLLCGCGYADQLVALL